MEKVQCLLFVSFRLTHRRPILVLELQLSDKTDWKGSRSFFFFF